MSRKDKIMYAIIIAILAAGLGVLRFLTIRTISVNYDNIGSGNMLITSDGDSSSISYATVEEIVSNENIAGGKFSSTNANENVISASGDIAATLSDVVVTKTSDSSGGNNTSFYGMNLAIIARDDAKLTINIINQVASSNIAVDSILQLAMNLVSSSTFSGMINSENAGGVELVLDSSSSISLTGDSYVKVLTNGDATNENIYLNRYRLYADGVELE